ncbi:MAG: MoxR family ATPase [Pseudomonadota bacterium]
MEDRSEEISAYVTQLASQGYIANTGLATVLALANMLHRPLLLEGEAGVGKTDIAINLARIKNCPLIRLQCYDGIDASNALYEWNYQKQMLAIHQQSTQADLDLFAEEYLLPRPLLEALLLGAQGKECVLLIDELDRADEPFEAFLLEILADFQITIPEYKTITAKHAPYVIITSNRTRNIHDAIKRRCLYHWVDYPSLEQEIAILQSRVPEASEELRMQIVSFVRNLRTLDLFKVPGIAETIEWARALIALNACEVTKDYAAQTLGVLIKYKDDMDMIDDSRIDALRKPE